jgi:hypothetical protein
LVFWDLLGWPYGRHWERNDGVGWRWPTDGFGGIFGGIFGGLKDNHMDLWLWSGSHSWAKATGRCA